MATTYTSPAFYDGPWARAFGDWLHIPEQTSRTYALNDIVKGPLLGIAVKVTAAVLSFDTPPETNGAPTMTVELQLTDGTTTKKLITLTAAQVAAGGVFYLDEYEGLGYVTPSAGFYVQAKVTAAPTTAAAAKLKFGVYATQMNYAGEDPTRPTG